MADFEGKVAVKASRKSTEFFSLPDEKRWRLGYLYQLTIQLHLQTVMDISTAKVLFIRAACVIAFVGDEQFYHAARQFASA